MFVTTPDFEQWVPPGLGPPQWRYWRAVTLSCETPWFLLTHIAVEDDCSAIQTVAVAWESTVETAEPGSVIGVLCLAPSRDRGGDWYVKRASELWLPSVGEESETGPLLFGLRGEPALYDSYHRRVANANNTSRQLLLRMTS